MIRRKKDTQSAKGPGAENLRIVAVRVSVHKITYPLGNFNHTHSTIVMANRIFMYNILMLFTQ